ncbi:MAG: aspartate dehydrogenase [Nitrososphaerales archaeon]
MERRLALIGCGAIGSVIARSIEREPDLRINILLDIVKEKAIKLANSLKKRPHIVDNLQAILDSEDINLVIEAASQKAVRDYALDIVRSGKDLMILSIGALLDHELYEKLSHEAKRRGVRIYIPSGAIAGLDAIRALADTIGIDEVTLTVKKSPYSFASSPYFMKNNIDPLDISKATILYDGEASEAVELFPANVNVAALLTLASRAKVRVRVVAIPRLNTNIHEILVHSKASKIRINLENIPHPENPKTSYLAALSAISLLKGLSNGFRLGN